MNSNEIADQILDFVAEECGLDRQSLAPDTALFTSGLLSSLDLIKVMMMIENRYGIDVETADMGLDQFDSASRLAQYVLTRAPR